MKTFILVVLVLIEGLFCFFLNTKNKALKLDLQRNEAIWSKTMELYGDCIKNMPLSDYEKSIGEIKNEKSKN